MTSYMNIMKEIEENEQAGKRHIAAMTWLTNPSTTIRQVSSALMQSGRRRVQALNNTYKGTSSSTSGDTDTKANYKTSKKPSGISKS